MTKRRRVLAPIVAAVVSAVACHSGGSTGGSTTTATSMPMPFEADPPSVYVAKIKNILVGLPPTDDEVKAVETDATQLGTLIDAWMALPQYSQKMMRFFELAFQQTQVSIADFADQAYPRQLNINGKTSPLLVQNAQESFARTMLQFISAQPPQPLTQGLTTHQILMTTALKAAYAFLDVYEVDDNGKVTDRFHAANPTLQITVSAKNGPIAIADSVDPTSPNYMHWYNPDVATFGAMYPGCQIDPVVYPASALGLFWLLGGGLDGHRLAATGYYCPQSGGTATAPQFLTTGATNDFNDWTMVTIRPPNGNERVTAFYDLPALRGAKELVLQVPRVGFFSTPAFFANWQTNTSNTMRVTMNQALIVALGASVDGTDTTTTDPSTPGIDTMHAAPPACFHCHQTLDPTRSIFSANFSWNYHNQVDATLTPVTSEFAFRGVTAPVKSLDDFANVLATHPLFAPAWVQKMCYWANSSPCGASDPVFQKVVADFQSSGYGWNAAVKALLSSAIVTNVTQTVTAEATGEVVAVSRRDHLCAALNARIGFTDVCGLDALGGKNASQGTIPEIVSGLPSDGYGRGGVAPILPNQPTLFYRAATENICEGVAAQVIDAKAPAPGLKQWSSAQPNAAIADFVSLIMGLTASDPRAPEATMLLQAHFTAAQQQSGTTATQALQSTFIAACMAPSAISIGM